jgi:Fuc2NAc and GlcNAc transferase
MSGLTVSAVIAGTLLLAAVAGAVLTGAVRRAALRRGMLDVPNARSSHVQPTPRGGGAAIVGVTLLGLVCAAALGGDSRVALLGVAVAGVLVAWIGWLDDRRPQSASKRLAVHVIAVATGLAAAGGLPPVEWGGTLVDLGAPGDVIAAVACVWFLNLFNFMDGIDGIAGSEAAFVGLAAAGFTVAAGAPTPLAVAWCALAGASVGFLRWNWAPAKIFMGDVGSGFLGAVIALLLVVSVAAGAFGIWTALVLVAPFAADATVTLVRRVGRGEKWYSAHRTHAYQWLARRFGSHARVSLLYAGLNVAIVLPAAWLTGRWTEAAPAIAGAVLGTLMIAAWVCDAGRAELRAPASDDTRESSRSVR